MRILANLVRQITEQHTLEILCLIFTAAMNNGVLAYNEKHKLENDIIR